MNNLNSTAAAPTSSSNPRTDPLLPLTTTITTIPQPASSCRCGCCGCCGGACTCGNSCSCSSAGGALDSRTSLCRCAAAELLETLGQLRGERGGTGGGASAAAITAAAAALGSPDGSNADPASSIASLTANGISSNQDVLKESAVAASTSAPNKSPSRQGCCQSKDSQGGNIDNNDSTTAPQKQSQLPPKRRRRRARTELEVDGMTCSMCSQAIESVVRGLDATTKRSRIVDVKVSLATDAVLVEWEDTDEDDEDIEVEDGAAEREPTTSTQVDDDHDVLTEQKIIDAIEGIGYTVAGVLSSQRTHRMGARSSSSSNGEPSSPLLSSPEAPPSLDRRTSPLLPASQLLSTSTHVAPPAANPSSNNNDWTNVQRRWDRLQERQDLKVRQRRDAFLLAFVLALPVVTLTMVLPHVAPNWAKKFEALQIVAWNGWRVSLQGVVLWLLASLTQFVCGWEFYKGTWFAIKSRRAGMDVLVCLGTTASYLYAMYGVFVAPAQSNSSGHNHGEHQHWEDTTHFFETSSMLIAFVLAGKWMQAAAVQRTSSAITSLLSLRSVTAIKITPFKDRQNFHPLKDPYKEATVPIEDVREGDLVKILPGNSVPADGRIVFGQVSVDESMLTGESAPVYKSTGAIVLGGTVCVESSTTSSSSSPSIAAAPAESSSIGAAFVQVTGVGTATALSQIIKLVTDAQLASSATPIQNFADTIASVFVPTVTVLSVLTMAAWYAACRLGFVPTDWYGTSANPESAFTFSLLFGIAVLVISCPCALGLATPTAIMVGTGVGAKLGVLIKSGQAAETAAKVDVVVFDKTGTLTLGSPTITDFFQLDEPGEFVIHGSPVDPSTESSTVLRQHFLWLLASLERTSTHPLAKAVVTYANDKVREPLAQPTNFTALTGRGASALVDGIPVACGNRAFAHALNLPIPRTVEECMVSLEDEGKTAILAAINGKVCVVMGVADEIKADAATSIAYLQERLGVEVWMVTGDNPRTAHAVGQHLGIPIHRVISEALPATKVQHVQRMQGEGRVVCFVGDGINDSPALAQSDVGLSVGTGTEIAAEASDMVLVAGNVSDVCTALDLSRAIFRRIQWNFVWSLMYNCLGIPIAAGALYPLTHIRLPPPVAAIAMALSSISVVLSSMALRLYRPPDLNSGRNQHRRSSAGATTLWARMVHRRQRLASSRRSRRRDRPSNSAVNDEDRDHSSMSEVLLESDHLMSTSSAGDATESTRCIDNRTASRLEAGTLV